MFSRLWNSKAARLAVCAIGTVWLAVLADKMEVKEAVEATFLAVGSIFFRDAMAKGGAVKKG